MEKKILVYDDACPACKQYTKWFVKTGLLRPEARRGWTEYFESAPATQSFDANRARHEIPLIDTEGKETLYGTDALVFILAQKIPFIHTLYNIFPIKWLAKKMYFFISYNRKIIAPSAFCSSSTCTPDFHLLYRSLFVFFTFSIAITITFLFGKYLGHFLNQDDGGIKMLFIAGTGWILQSLIALFFLRDHDKTPSIESKLNYIAQLGVIMVLGVVCLIPPILIGKAGYFHWGIPSAFVLLSSLLMLREHIRRIKFEGKSNWWTISWFLSLQITATYWVWIFYLK